MRKAAIGVILLCALCPPLPAPAQQARGGPADPKAQKTNAEALKFVQHRMDEQALDSFKKADKQDGGKCAACQLAVVKYGMEFQDWKAATQAAEEELAEAQTKRDTALAHCDLGQVFLQEGLSKNRPELFTQSHEELSKALETYPNFPNAMFLDGRALAHLNQDDAAKAQFQTFLKVAPAGDIDLQRAERYMSSSGERVRYCVPPPKALAGVACAACACATSFFSRPSIDASPICSSRSTPLESIVKVCGIA
jgi:Flp pilus assembly protein TadD